MEFLTRAAIVPKEGQDGLWLLDLEDKKALPFLALSTIKIGTLICFDAKEVLGRGLIRTESFSKLLCISTLKKLLAKDDKSFQSPVFSKAEEAFLWLDKVLSWSFSAIKSRNIQNLVDLECALIPVLVRMEQVGLPFQKEQWLTELGLIEEELLRLKKAIEPYFIKEDGFLLFGQESIDLGQVSLVKKRLEELVGHKIPGTSSSVLKTLDHEAARLLMRYRELERMLSTYGENFLAKIKNDRIHATFVAIASASGRSTCVNPNLQALPNDPAFQACIKSKAPYGLLSFDYGGFELRILAGLSMDEELLKIFNDDRDIHSVVAETLFKVEVSSEKNAYLRAQAKIFNFGIIYGMGEKSLAQQLSLSLLDASKLMHNYFKRFSKLRQFLEGLEQQAKERGFVQTSLGRRAYFLDGSDKAHNLRVARNIPVQGTGAEITKLALCRVHKNFIEQNLDAAIVNMIHDEIVIECHQEQWEKVRDVVLFEMHGAFNAVLPSIKAEVSLSLPANFTEKKQR